ncbi:MULTISPECIES: FHA domain-containing protein [Myxococcus]|uniref:FHA domain-containing protein n=1 Tax=Myxococcus llanfairpwllgwyngyllgogerychwyrndrobwllllantysiliogogogochensis TaxID=2590453 RepID=A0A540WLK8_9BACT|nr:MULTISPECIES: FHA domain-containing protein [Myxococcus]NTX03518.1 FHA domain-containing protein [Myxococcus sp. CA040A]TQF09727.1 FHA domain-containing protein [Myxococcus llanfairpwllgwyngyllgogerychwyrndrobwllllantysiliogogogochensis]
MSTLVVRLPDGTENEYEVAGELKLGRQQGCEVLLTEGGVSRTHARVFSEAGTVFIEDLGSANGTFVDGERIAEPTALTPQSEVILGDYTLSLKAAPGRATGARRASKPAGAEAMPVGAEGGGARATRALPSIKAKPAGATGAGPAKRPPRPAGGPPGGGGGPLLRGTVGPWAGKTFPLKGKVLVGRLPPAGIILEDDSVSRKHAELESVGGGVRVRDLGSANGTLLNGDPLGPEPVDLEPGDQLQFGVVEMTFETPQADAPARRGAGSAPPSRRRDSAQGGGADPEARRKKLFIAGGGLVGVLLLAALGKALMPETAVDPGGPMGTGAVVDPAQQVSELLSECRSYASSELGPPNWVKAEQICSQVLDLDPINTDANTLIRRIKLEKDAFEHFSMGEKLQQRLKPEEALDSFRKIPKESEYFRRARAKAAEAAEQVTKRALDDCKRYLRDSQWSAAVPRCQTYMAVWCQNQPRDDLQPPLGYEVRLEGRLKKNEWRPKDPLFVKFLISRIKLDPNSIPWTCPVAEVLNRDNLPTDPKTVVLEAVKGRYPNKLMQAAMMDYWAGRGSEALATLQKLRASSESAQFHAQADEMLKTMSTVDQLFKGGQSYLAADDPEKAAEPLREALEVDKSLMLDLAEPKPSFYRRSILADMADKSYQRGKHWADRDDKRRACRMWKLGFGFYAGNPDLNKAAGFCSATALSAFRQAGGCPDMAAVLDFAVKGDGVEELVVAKKKEWSCP